MSSGETNDQAHDEGNGERLRGTVARDALPVDLVSAFAGDRAMTQAEGARIRVLQETRGNVFYSDLFYAISHHYFAPEIAEDVWNQVLAHKVTMSAELGRNVRITVATLDYLSNIMGEMRPFTLMAEIDVAAIVNLSMRDGMTGLFNHSTCYELLELELKNHRRYGVGVALILLDIDDFKQVNDRWGHQEGDRILRELAKTMGEETRESDICCRFGGEEFAVILPFTGDPLEARMIAERIRAGAARLESRGQGITISAGLAQGDASTPTAQALVERADRALYRAKREGKNRVVGSTVAPAAPSAGPTGTGTGSSSPGG
jgi:diguanylate cyclase (GGDEF)-like protein